jgi:c(7)-type cytochrome triheme protein
MPTFTASPIKTRIQRHLIACAALLLSLTFFVAMASGSVTDAAKMQQIKFSHQFHVGEAGIACVDCHTNASKSVKSADNLLAKMEACRTCHEDQLSKNCTYCHMDADTSKYTAILNPVRDLIFSHQQHVENQKVSCETCHTVLEKAGTATSELVPAMTTCATCHDGKKVVSACETCHTNFAALRPNDHNQTDFIHEHKRIARMGDAKCGMCHSQETCIDCHNGSDLVKINVPGRDMTSQHSPRLTANDRGQGMRLSKVHDLNFRVTHGIVARSKSMECQTCHNEKEFCSTCHDAGGNINQGAFKPASHLAAGFTTFGVGSGGGEHARLARRDIESCAMCHASDGADPVCIRCHTDADGIKGTDARTHEPGFLSNNHGIWHSDPGANCYVCHTDYNANPSGRKGQKFCGYCHH